MWKAPKRDNTTRVDTFMPKEVARPVDRADKKITVEEYDDIQNFYRNKCNATEKYTE